MANPDNYVRPKLPRCGSAGCTRPECQQHDVPGVIAKHQPHENVPTSAGQWLENLTSAERKECAVSRGFFAYFPDAIALVARHSVRMNEKHNPGQPVHWAREKSRDHEDCIGRHSLAIAVDPDSTDDGQPHIVCRAWRAFAALQEWAEKQNAQRKVTAEKVYGTPATAVLKQLDEIKSNQQWNPGL